MRPHHPDHLRAPPRVPGRDRHRLGRGSGDYGGGFGQPTAPPSAAPRRPVAPEAVEALGRFIIHYPSYILFVALANRLDIFLHAYLALNAAYAARAILGIARKLGPGQRTA